MDQEGPGRAEPGQERANGMENSFQPGYPVDVPINAVQCLNTTRVTHVDVKL